MWFRIGINLGDVMVENDDLYGEGVNIAARLQELAEPGGILISGPVYDIVRNKLSVGFEHLGQQPVKNVTEPVISYRIVLDGDVRPRWRARRGDRQRPFTHSRTAWRQTVVAFPRIAAAGTRRAGCHPLLVRRRHVRWAGEHLVPLAGRGSGLFGPALAEPGRAPQEAMIAH